MTDNNARDLQDLDLETILKEIHNHADDLLESEDSSEPQDLPAPEVVEPAPESEQKPASALDSFTVPIPEPDSQPIPESSIQPPDWEEPVSDFSGMPELTDFHPLEDNAPYDAPAQPAEESLPVPDTALEGDTVRFSPITDELVLQTLSNLKEQSAQEEPASGQPTPPGPGPAFDVEEEFIPSPSLFTSQSQLRRLKKKLISGPERLYYNLSETGTVKLQLAILLSVLTVLICSAVTTLFALNMIPANRLKLVIITQILAMLFSALLGSQLMIDSFIELFRGKFTVKALLTVTFFVCMFDAYFCLKELRIPCCAAFSLEMTMALWAQLHERNINLSQLDTMRKAVRLHGLTRVKDYYSGKDALLRTIGEVEDFMEHYDKMTAPQIAQSVYTLVSLAVCIGIAIFAGQNHGLSMAIQILSTSLLVAVPASFFVSISRPTAILAQRLHMVGTVLCGWQGVLGLCRKAAFPIYDQDLFPNGSSNFNGVKFYGDEDPGDVVSYSASLINVAGGTLVSSFKKLIKDREGVLYKVQNFQRYSGGGIGGEIHGIPVLLGSLNFLQDMGVEIPEGTMVNQAVYAAIDGQLSAVYAITYSKSRFATAGLVSLCGSRKTIPIMLTRDFMLTESFLRSKFNVKTKNIVFPEQDTAAAMRKILPDPDAPCLALVTRTDLISFTYAVSGARALRTATQLGLVIHIVGGVLGMLIMLALAVLGNTELLTPTNVLLYQLIWAVPGLLVTEWTRIL